jgi:polyisoprenoid-binding protein YceI
VTRIFLLSLLTATCGGQVSAETGVYGLDPLTPTDTVRFESTARLEFIEGKTTEISGGVRFDPGNTRTEVSGVLAVDLRSLRTGIGLRDEHMRDRHLHTEKYPLAFFVLSGLSDLPSELTMDSTHTADVQGYFYLHGVKRDLRSRADVTRMIGTGGVEALKVRAEFAIRLEDYSIPRPKALFVKLAEEVKVTVVFTAYRGVQPGEAAIPDWPMAQNGQ